MTTKVKLAIIAPDEVIHQRGGQKWLNFKNDVKKSLNSNKSKAGHSRFFIKNRIKYRHLENIRQFKPLFSAPQEFIKRGKIQ